MGVKSIGRSNAYTDLDYVPPNELGHPYDPARLRPRVVPLMRQADVRKIRPYDASRHAAGSYLSRQGVSPAIIAAWLGHSDASFTMRTYVHAPRGPGHGAGCSRAEDYRAVNVPRACNQSFQRHLMNSIRVTN
jgi:hypothetical protein